MKILILIFVLISFSSKSQNIITNGNLENYSNCPNNMGQLNKAVDWHGINGGGGSCEYFNSCDSLKKTSVPKNLVGFQQARSGQAYIGQLFYSKGTSQVGEVSSNNLKSALIFNVEYKIQLFLSKTEVSKYAIAEIGVIITDSLDAINIYAGNIPPNVLNKNGYIFDTLNWIKIEATFIANGGEKYIAIGCFNKNPSDSLMFNQNGLNGAYYYIDDVALYPTDAPIATAQCINDTLICKGNAVAVGKTQIEQQYKAEYKHLWYKANHEKDTLSIEQFPIFYPDTTTTYVLKLTDFKYDITYDSVKVEVADCKQPTSLKVYPNPTNNVVYFSFNNPITEDLQIDLFNILGQNISYLDYKRDYQHNTVQLNLSMLSTGLYFYRVVIDNKAKFEGKIVKL